MLGCGTTPDQCHFMADNVFVRGVKQKFHGTPQKYVCVDHN